MVKEHNFDFQIFVSIALFLSHARLLQAEECCVRFQNSIHTAPESLSWAFYAMPVFDNLEFRYIIKKTKQCPRLGWLGFQVFYGV